MKFSEIKYERPDFEKEFAFFNTQLDKIENAQSKEEYFELLKELSDASSFLEEQYTLAYIRNTINKKDEFYEKEMELFDEQLPRFSEPDNRLKNIRLNSKFREDFEKEYGKTITLRDKLQKDIFKPEIIEDRIKENKLSSEYQKLMGTALVDWEGEKKNLSQMVLYTQSEKRDVRKKAFEVVTQWFVDNKSELDRLYDELVKVRHSIAKKLGFDSYTEVAYRTMGRIDWDRNDAKKYREQIEKHIVPLTQKLYEEQKERIGISDFKFYDVPLMFLSGNPAPKGDAQKLVEAAKVMYKELSPETDEFFIQMWQKEMMDLDSKDGKQPGGYMTFLPVTKLPFIFANFNETAHDVDVLTHEAGHAFQGYVTRDMYPRENAGNTMEIMETHSMSMEYFTHPWMESFFGEDTEKYYYSHVVNSLLFLPYGASIDEFQEYVYDNPNATPEERNAKYREIEKKYLPHIDYAGVEYLESGARWQRQMHVYEMPFYYLDYTIAQINAFQFFVLDMENHKEAWEKYLELCKFGGKLGTVDIIKQVGLDNPFEDGTIAKITTKLEKYLDTLDKEKIK